MKVFEKIYLGDKNTAKDIDFIKENQIKHVLNVTSCIKNYFEKGLDMKYLNSLPTTPLSQPMESKKEEEEIIIQDPLIQDTNSLLGVDSFFSNEFIPQTELTSFPLLGINVFSDPVDLMNITKDESEIQEFKITYLKVPADDSMNFNIKQHFKQCIDFIKSATENVLVHCREGKSRSVSILIAYGMKELGLSLKDCYETITKLKDVNINDGFKRQLMDFEKEVFGVKENSLNFFPQRKRKQNYKEDEEDFVEVKKKKKVKKVNKKKQPTILDFLKGKQPRYAEKRDKKLQDIEQMVKENIILEPKAIESIVLSQTDEEKTEMSEENKLEKDVESQPSAPIEKKGRGRPRKNIEEKETPKKEKKEKKKKQKKQKKEKKEIKVDEDKENSNESNENKDEKKEEKIEEKMEEKNDSSKKKKKEKKKSKEQSKDSTDQKGWCQAKIQAFHNIDKNPNAYYYRFNHPDEEQKNGKWNKEEKELFIKKLEGFNMNNPQWGLFSKDIPGRVGYQCANFYRSLVKNGEIKDPNYVVSEGKLRYKFKKEKE